MNSVSNDSIIKGIISKLKRIRDLAKVTDTVSKANSLREIYEETRSHINSLGYYDIVRLMPYTSKLSTWDDVTQVTWKIVAGCDSAIAALETLLAKIPLETKDKLESLKEELSSIENIDFDIQRNLDEAIKECEMGHYLASALISSRVIVYILSKVKGKTDEDRVKNLVEQNLIPKDRKDEIMELMKASRLARNLLSHRVDIDPRIEDTLIVVSNAIKLTKILTKL